MTEIQLKDFRKQRFVRHVNLLNKLISNPDSGQLIMMADRSKTADYWLYYMQEIAQALGLYDLRNAIQEVQMLAKFKTVIAAEAIELCQKYFSPEFGIVSTTADDFLTELESLIITKA